MTWRASQVEPGGAAAAVCAVCGAALWTPATAVESPSCEPHSPGCWASDPLQVEADGLPLWSAVTPVWVGSERRSLRAQDVRDPFGRLTPEAASRPWAVALLAWLSRAR